MPSRYDKHQPFFTLPGLLAVALIVAAGLLATFGPVIF